jgi:SAM-dependent methyltransferase
MSAVTTFSHQRFTVGQPAVAGALSSSAERQAELAALLERTSQMLSESQADAEPIGQALDGLFGGLAWHKATSSDEDWQAAVRHCRAHRLLAQIHEDPFTARAYRKPRGYAGDAELLDLIYGPEENWPAPQASPLGLGIYRYTSSAPAAEGVRARRAYIADLIDSRTAEVPGQQILAVASGHLREASLMAALRRRRVGRFVALDADPISLAEVQRCYGVYGVETVPAPFSHLVTGRVQLGQFDLVYTTGLFDYLSRSTGRRLVRTLFDMVRPGGQLIVANFMPGIGDMGFMEAFMDWRLIYRNRHDMIDLTMEIDESEVRELTLFTEESRNIIFSRITRN